MVVKQLVQILLMLLTGWSWSLGLRPWCWWQCGWSALVGDDGALLAEQVAQALLELEGELLQLGEGGEERGGESLGEDTAEDCC